MTPYAIAIYCIAGLFGLLIGSFLNAVIYRLPRECMSIVRQTRSFCPRCGVQLAWFDNIPLVSYMIWLRGRCRACRAPISWRYPLIEAVTAAAFVGIAWRDFAALHTGAMAIPAIEWAHGGAHALIFSVLLVLSCVDLDFQILPDQLTISGIVAAPLLAFAMPALMPRPLWGPFGDGAMSPHWTALANGVVGAALSGFGLWLIGWIGSKLARKEAMGFGDVKLFAAMGGLLGFWIPMALAIASFAGSIIGIARWFVTGDKRLPFGPFLALGMWVVLLWGPGLWEVVKVGLLPRH